MKQFFQDVKNSFLLSAAVSIILGIVLIVYPVKTSLLICYIAGALLLFGGVVALIRYIASRGEPFFFRYDLFVALVLMSSVSSIWQTDCSAFRRRSTSKKQGWKNGGLSSCWLF